MKVQADRHEAVLVALSFGKDSLVVMDMCAKYFKRVEAFCMSWVTGLDITKRWLQFARDRWDVEVKEIEHWGAKRHKQSGSWCIPVEIDGKPGFNVTLEEQKREYGIPIVATGTRAAESLGRRAGLLRAERGIKGGAWAGDWHPIAWWRRENVIAYLRQNNLPLEDSDKDMQGWSNDRQSFLKLHQQHPEDFKRWCKVFPFAEAVIRQKEWYGTPVTSVG